LRLTIEYKGNESAGIIACEDPDLLARLFEVLSKNQGKSIHEIGDIEVE
jgi:hypothetical protein